MRPNISVFREENAIAYSANQRIDNCCGDILLVHKVTDVVLKQSNGEIFYKIDILVKIAFVTCTKCANHCFQCVFVCFQCVFSVFSGCFCAEIHFRKCLTASKH